MGNTPDNMLGRPWREWLVHFPQLDQVSEGRPLLWNNDHCMPAASAVVGTGFTTQDVDDVFLRLRRFAPFMRKAFPQTEGWGGLPESPLREIPSIMELLSRFYKLPAGFRVLFKLDNQLPVSGSVKDRGCANEVFSLVENLAIYAKKLKWSDDYAKLAEPEMREFFGQFSLSMVSGGDLGLAAGLFGHALGFKVTVHTPGGCAAWRKEALEAKGVNVVARDAGYDEIFQTVRNEVMQDKSCFFVDEEASRNLFLGYAASGRALREQLTSLGVSVDSARPLYVYLPCSSSLEAAGLCFGLKLAFLDNVRCFLAEPVQAPTVLLGLGTKLFDQISVSDAWLSGQVDASIHNGGSPSGLACHVLRDLLDGCVTVDDKALLRMLALARQNEPLKTEFPALAGILAFIVVAYSGLGGRFANGTHIIWINGGGLAPLPLA